MLIKYIGYIQLIFTFISEKNQVICFRML